MKNFSIKNIYKINVAVVLAMLLIIGCEPDDTDAFPATKPTTAAIFLDGFSGGLDFSAFGDSKVTAFQTDDEITYEKSALSMRFDVPNEGDPESGYAGGIFFDKGGRDLSGYNVLSFYGRSSVAATIQELGFGLYDTEVFKTSINDVSFSTAWTKFYIILPDASRLTDEQGMFYFVDTPDDGAGYSFWIDEVKYESLDTIGDISPIFQNGNNESVQAFVGQVLDPGGLGLSFTTPQGFPQSVTPSPAYFSLSSNSGNATIQLNANTMTEEIVLVGEGEAVITAEIGGIAAAGSLTLGISDFVAAPTPVQDPANVISIFSDAYTNVPVDFYNGFYAPFQTTESADFEVNGDNVLNYINYNFVGIEFNQNVPTIDGTEMSFLHADIFIPEDFDPASTLRINLRDFGADGSFDGGDDSLIDLVLSTSTTPALVTGEWISVDFDISSLTNRANLGQIVFDAETNEGERPSGFFVDNLYLYKEDDTGGVDPIPPSAPPADPTQAEADVISIYSDSYTDVPKDGFNLYGAAAFEEVDIAGSGNSALKYTFVAGDGGNFQVIELGGANQIDLAAAGMTNFRFDLYFPNEVDGSTNYLMKLVDFGATTSEAQLFVDGSSTPPIAQGSWLSFDFTLADLATAGLTGTSNIQQLVIDLLSSGEVYVDNIYFYDSSGGSGGSIPPSAPPADPTQAEADVISIYSDSYTDVPKDGFNLYGAAAFEEVDIAGSGNSALKYTWVDTGGGNFQVIELGGANQLDLAAAGMTNFRFDLYFPNEVDGSTNFLLKLVDFGATTSEAQLFVDGSSTPPIAQGSWLSFDFTLADLATAGLTGTSNIQQLVIDLLSSGEVYVDNIYFYDSSGGSGGSIPPAAPPADPTQAEADVISIYSDSYTDVPKDGFNLYGAAAFEEVDIAGSGNSALKYTWVDTAGGNFQVIELGGANQLDLATAGMTNFRFDLYFPNEVDGSTNFLLKLVDFGATTSEAQLFVDGSSTPPIAQGSWLSFDFTLADLATAGLTGTSNIQQVVIDLLSSGEVYIDNIYFYK